MSMVLGLYFLLTLLQVIISSSETPSPTVNTRIVGGTWVKRGAHPYQAAIMLKDIGFHCGGTLIDETHILTAAHCFDIPDITVDKITVNLMTTVLDPLDVNHIQRGVGKYVKHEQFNTTNFENDIAILTLDQPVLNVRPVQLEPAGSKEEHIGETALLIGWGRIRQILYPNFSSGPYSNQLRQANVTILGAQDCKIYSNAVFFDDILKFVDNGARICVSTLHGRGICQGDSGGPLLIKGVQIGIISAASRCADPRLPAVLTRISTYRDWIAKNVN